MLFLFYNLTFIEGMGVGRLSNILHATAQLTALRSLRVRFSAQACLLMHAGRKPGFTLVPDMCMLIQLLQNHCLGPLLFGMMCSCVVQLTVPPEWNEQTEINGAAWAMILALPKLASVVLVVTVDEPATADREVSTFSPTS